MYKTKRKRFLSLCMAAALLISLLAACGGDSNSSSSQAEDSSAASSSQAESSEAKNDASESGEEVELLLYHRMGEMTGWFTDFCAEVSEKYPNIHIEQETQKDESTLQVKYAAGEDPEILVGPATQQYIDMGKYNPFDNYPELLERLKPVAKSTMTNPKDGKIYKLPLCVNSYGLFYNKNIFNELNLEAPKSWDELINVLETIKTERPDVTPFYTFGESYGHQFSYWANAPLVEELGIEGIVKAAAFNDKEALHFDQEGGYLEQYATKILELRDRGYFDEDVMVNGTLDMAAEAFATGKAAIVPGGTWWWGSLKNNFPEVADFVGFGPIPSLMEGGTAYTSAGADSAVSYTSNPEHQEEIGIVLAELFDEERLSAYSAQRGAPSSMEGVESDWGVLADMLTENWEEFPPIVFQLEYPTGFALGDIQRLGQDLLVGTYTPREYAEEFTRRWNDCFE